MLSSPLFTIPIITFTFFIIILFVLSYYLREVFNPFRCFLCLLLCIPSHLFPSLMSLSLMFFSLLSPSLLSPSLLLTHETDLDTVEVKRDMVDGFDDALWCLVVLRFAGDTDMHRHLEVIFLLTHE